MSTKLTIVVPTFRSELYIRGLMESLATQHDQNFEVVVSDGKSDDNTLSLIRDFGNRIGTSQVILSRADSGVYDAINKGIAAASGEWILVLGADDRLASPDVTERLNEVLASATDDIIYGDVRVIGENMMVPSGERYGGKFDFARILGQNICQQAIIYRKASFKRWGMFKTEYRLWADWEFAVRVVGLGRTRWIDCVVTDYCADGMSSKGVDHTFKRKLPSTVLGVFLRKPLSFRLYVGLAKSIYWKTRR